MVTDRHTAAARAVMLVLMHGAGADALVDASRERRRDRLPVPGHLGHR